MIEENSQMINPVIATLPSLRLIGGGSATAGGAGACGTVSTGGWASVVLAARFPGST